MTKPHQSNFYLLNLEQGYSVSNRPLEIIYLHTFIFHKVSNLDYAIDVSGVGLVFSSGD